MLEFKSKRVSSASSLWYTGAGLGPEVGSKLRQTRREEKMLRLQPEQRPEPTENVASYRFTYFELLNFSWTTKVKENINRGFASNIEIYCPSCNHVFSNFWTSTGSILGCFDVNLRSVLAFREMGLGYKGASTLANNFNMKVLSAKGFDLVQLKTKKAVASELPKWKAKAADAIWSAYKEVGIDGDIVDITISYDGTWQKRAIPPTLVLVL